MFGDITLLCKWSSNFIRFIFGDKIAAASGCSPAVRGASSQTAFRHRQPAAHLCVSFWGPIKDANSLPFIIGNRPDKAVHYAIIYRCWRDAPTDTPKAKKKIVELADCIYIASDDTNDQPYLSPPPPPAEKLICDSFKLSKLDRSYSSI